MEIFYLPDHGIHKIQVTDETGIKQELGPPFTANIDPNIKRTAIEFQIDQDTHRRPIGFNSQIKYDGIASIGLIFIDPGCRPKTGSFINPISNTTGETETIIVEKIVEKESDSDGVVIAVVVTVILLLAIFTAFTLYLYFCCIKRHKHKIEILETIKAHSDQVAKKNAIVSSMPDDDLEQRKVHADDSAREGLKAGSKRYEDGDDAETIEIQIDRKQRSYRDSEDPSYSQGVSFSACNYDEDANDCALCYD